MVDFAEIDFLTVSYYLRVLALVGLANSLMALLRAFSFAVSIGACAVHARKPLVALLLQHSLPA